MNNWKFHLKCLLTGLVIFVVLALGCLFIHHLFLTHPRVCFGILITPLVLIGLYSWGRAIEMMRKK